MKLPFISLLFVLPISVLADNGLPNQPYLYVQGFAEIEKPADMATLRFDVVTRNPDQEKANQEVQSKANRVFALLNDKKIAEKDVSAGDIKSEPQYEDENAPHGRSKIVGFKITRTFQAKVRDIATIPKLVDDLLAISGVEFSNIESALSNEKELEDQARKDALNDARQRSEKTLHELGMKIDSVFAVSPVAFPEISQNIFPQPSLGVGNLGGSASGPNKSRESTSQYRLPTVSIFKNIHLIYLISPAK